MNSPNPDCRKCSLSADELAGMQALLPANVILLAAPVDDWMNNIDPEERDIVRQAVSSRRAEFSTGRMLAARACLQLGVPAAPILRGAMNEPIWPEGVTGSITHTSDVCLVAVAQSDQIVGVGIDIEASHRKIHDLANLILRHDERRAIAEKPSRHEDRVHLVFGAKESVYKAIYARAGRFIDFQEVRIDFGPDDNEFNATAPDDRDLNVLVRAGSGRYLVAENAVFSAWYQIR